MTGALTGLYWIRRSMPILRSPPATIPVAMRSIGMYLTVVGRFTTAGLGLGAGQSLAVDVQGHHLGIDGAAGERATWPAIRYDGRAGQAQRRRRGVADGVIGLRHEHHRLTPTTGNGAGPQRLDVRSLA